MKTLARALFPAIGLLAAAASTQVAAGPNQARSVQMVGTAGYLSEWELNADLVGTVAAQGQRLSGSLRFKHVGLCSSNGPEEKTGEITVQISGSGSSSQMDATLLFDGMQCKATGTLSGEYRGVMECSGAKGVPLALSLK